MIRLTLLYLLFAFLAAYAWRDWYKALCGLILLVAVIEHPDMPKSLLGVQGLNPWNVVLFVILLAWASSRRREGLSWDMPGRMNLLLLLYLSVIVISFFRMMSDYGTMVELAFIAGKEPPTKATLWSEHLINAVKWVIPGLLLYDGCRSRSRFCLGLFSLLAVYFFLALLVIRWMPLGTITGGEELTKRSGTILLNEVGYHRVNLAMMLAGAAWAIFAAKGLVKRRSHEMLIIAAGLTVVFALALTGGRTGYGTCMVVGLVIGALRWRKILLLAPLLVAAVTFFVPAAAERMTQGFTSETRDDNAHLYQGAYVSDGVDLYTVTAGRNIAWPYVIEKIHEEPWFGYGREAMERTGITAFLWNEFREPFPHPHNAYLQLLLDNGWIGFIPIIIFYLLIVKYSVTLFRDSRSLECTAVGGVTLSLVTALLVASIGSQTFYPREGVVGMWCAIGLMLRIFVERSRILETSHLSRRD